MGLGNSIARANPILLVKEITDTYLRQNFQNMADYFAKENQFLGFKFFDLTFSAAVTNTKVQHGLTTIPEDVVVTKIVGTGSVSFNFGKFDSTNLDLTVTGPCRVRFYIGSYWNSEGAQIPAITDQTTFTASPGGGTSNVNQVVVPATSGNATPAIEYQIANNNDYIFTNPPSVGMTLFLPPAASVADKLITVQSISLLNYLTTIKTDPADTRAYIDQPTLLSVAIRMYKAEVKFISNGTFYRTVGNFLDTIPASAPTYTVLIAGTSATYTKPVGCKWIRIRMVGGGGGGAGGGAPGGGGAGGNGGSTIFGVFTAGGGQGGQANAAGGAGGTNVFPAGSIGFQRVGSMGHSGGSDQQAGSVGTGGNGGSSFWGGGGAGSPAGVGAGAGAANSGSGGGGGSCSGAAADGGGGGASGGYVEAIIHNPAATYIYSIGAAGIAGVPGAGAGGNAAGSLGGIIVEEYYI